MPAAKRQAQNLSAVASAQEDLSAEACFISAGGGNENHYPVIQGLDLESRKLYLALLCRDVLFTISVFKNEILKRVQDDRVEARC